MKRFTLSIRMTLACVDCGWTPTTESEAGQLQFDHHDLGRRYSQGRTGKNQIQMGRSGTYFDLATELLEHCDKLGDLPVGSAVLTAAANLQADYVVHAIVRSIDEQVSESTVHRALQNALRRCVEWGLETLALPPLGTGAGNLDAEDAAGVMVPVLLEHMRDADFPAHVTIVVESEYERDVFQSELARYDLPIL